MSQEEDIVHDAVERLEWDERKEENTPHEADAAVHPSYRPDGWRGRCRGADDRGLRRLELQLQLQLVSSGTSTARPRPAVAAPPSGIFGSSKPLKFTLVNHVTTNPFFTPTQNGAADACKLLGCTYQWTGSQTSNVSEMVNAINSAVTAGVDGIAHPADRSQGVQQAGRTKALAAKIPVVAYNADEPQTAGCRTSGRICSSPASRWAPHIAELVPSGDVALFIATPGAANIQPRIDGALQTLKTHSGDQDPRDHHGRRGAGRARRSSTPTRSGTRTPRACSPSTPAPPRASPRRSRSSAWPRRASRAGAMTSPRSPSSCWPPATSSSRSISSPISRASCRSCELYMYNVSQGLSGVADVDTGLKFLDKTTVLPYSSHQEPVRGHRHGSGRPEGVVQAGRATTDRV